MLPLSKLRHLLVVIGALLLLNTAQSASASAIELRDSFSQDEKPAAADLLPQSNSSTWTWLSLEAPAQLKELPANWQLTVDQARFARLAVVTVNKDGEIHVIDRSENALDENGALGGRLRFTITEPGDRIRHLYIGFEDLDDLSLMRTVEAVSPDQFASSQQKWLLLMGIFCGILASSFFYNLFLFLRQRKPFQLLYLGWVASALLYGTSWTNLIGIPAPALVGPFTVRANYVLVAATIALAALFLLTILEPDKLPRRLRNGVRVAVAACLLSGCIAVDERVFTAASTDRIFNLAMLTLVGLSLLTIASAWRSGSRVVRIFVVGWTPVVLAFAARSARNFGLLPQSDWVDMATFGAIALESVMFSLAIASRFADLRRERDTAAERARAVMLEAETLRRAAQGDFLTGLANRSVFHPKLDELIRNNADFDLYLIDVDFLKELNDRDGHAAGDAILRFIGRRLAAVQDEKTCVARIGGDEFAIIAQSDGLHQNRVGELLADLQGCTWSSGGYSGNLSLSVGSSPSTGIRSPEEALRCADIALYEAKNSGRGQHIVFDSRLRARTLDRAQLIAEARLGLDRDEFLLFFQPVLDLRTSRLCSHEALLRWQHPTRGLLAPQAFWEIFEDQEVGPAIQERVLSLALTELQRRRSEPSRIAVNFTAMDLHGEAAAISILSRLEAAGVAASSLCVEVTEGILLERAASEPISALRILHKAGVQIALDDFGTGYASLVHLKMVPVDILKIDRTFVAGLLEDTNENEQIVRAIIALGHGLGKKIVAEGVEEVDQWARLQALGCDFGQGYLFGRPQAAVDLGALPSRQLRAVA